MDDQIPKCLSKGPFPDTFIDFFLGELIHHMLHRRIACRYKSDGKISGYKRNNKSYDDQRRQGLVNANTAGLESENLGIVCQPGESYSDAEHSRHRYRVEEHIGEEIGEQPDEVPETDVEFKN